MQTANGTENITEYKIGNTTYYVETIFNPNPRAESLDELIERLIGKEIAKIIRQD